MSRVTDGGLRPLLRQHLPMVHWTTVESGAISPGTPDIHGCYNSVDFWIECKVTARWGVTLRPEQVGWLLRRARAGGRGCVLIRRQCVEGPRRERADQLWLVPGARAAEARAGGLRSPEACAELLGEGGPALWPWPALLERLAA